MDHDMLDPEILYMDPIFHRNGPMPLVVGNRNLNKI